MKSAFFRGSGTFEVEEIAAPQANAGEAVVRVRHCGICGSDLHWFRGHSAVPSVCPGHEFSGEVTVVGQGGDSALIGQPVVVEPLITCQECWACRSGSYQLCQRLRLIGIMRAGGFAEQVVVPARSLYPLPPGMDFELASLTEPTAVAVHATRLAGVSTGDRVLVLGAGTIGLLSVLAVQAAGAREVCVTARHPHQAEMARDLGAARVFDADARGQAELADYAKHSPIDSVLETVGGAANTLAEGVERVRSGGTVVMLGVFNRDPSLPALSLLFKEVRVVGSMVYGRTGPRSDFEEALNLLSAHAVTVGRLVTHRFALRDVQAAFETAGDKMRGAIKVTVMP